MTALVAWLVAGMVLWAPTTAPAELERYRGIATDVAAVAEARPLAGDVPTTAALLLAVASFESGGFRADVDACKVTGDGGRARTLWQLHGAPREACRTRQLAAHLALDAVAESWRMCGRGRLEGYVSGRCDRGQRVARLYEARASSFASTWLAPVK